MDILHKLSSYIIYAIRKALSRGYNKVCPECGCLNMFAALYCISCGRDLRLSQAEGVFAILTNPRQLSWYIHIYRRGGLGLVREFFADFCNPVRG